MKPNKFVIQNKITTGLNNNIILFRVIGRNAQQAIDKICNKQ